ncbi:hypothetical protein [Dysgonomonas capnocytophagoides]|uniref:hypothetical protein n=1 Tax=Dysgonomonas capnocytophagoides TaxID=45254 RepID=UPI002A7FDC90|nr:hypothetical protein [Dysgonomonas capnocytophagoides]
MTKKEIKIFRELGIDTIMKHLNDSSTIDSGIWYYNSNTKTIDLCSEENLDSLEFIMPFKQDLVSYHEIISRMEDDFNVTFETHRPGVSRRVREAGYHDCVYDYTDMLIRERLNEMLEIG